MLKTIYIVSSGDILSGGVSSMHNLCKGLIDGGYNAKMYYVYANENLIREKFAERFNVPRAMEILDSQENLMVVPEILPRLFDDYLNIKKAVYWLSLQFFFKNKGSYPWPLSIKLIRKPFYSEDFFNESPGFIESIKQKILFSGIRKSKVWSKNIIHITNSFYTFSFCKFMGANQVHLLHNPLIDEVFTLKQNPRKNKILIGAKTSRLLVFFLKKYCIGYDVIRIKGMPINKVYDLMSESLVFAEFGISNRDRTPREAAILGCIVYTSNGGSAHYSQDVPIPNRYKFKDKVSNVYRIARSILYSAKNYKELNSDFDQYRKLMREEKDLFSNRACRIIEKILEQE